MKIYVLAAMLLAGCTTVSTNMLDDRTAIFSGRGSAFNDIGDVAAKILVRAATEAQKRGYPYFAVMGSQNANSTGYYTTPSTTSGSGMVTGSCIGNTCSGIVSGSSTTQPGQTYAFDKPGADVMVRFFRAGEVDPNARGVWSVANVLAANVKR